MSVVLAFDTATPATVVGARVGRGPVVERRHDPGEGERPGHAAQLLVLAREALAEAGAALEDVTRIGCGVGPGTFTGLRVGVATARGLAQAHGAELVPVSTLAALAHGIEVPVLAVLDARRGEVFAQPFVDGEPLAAPVAVVPEAVEAGPARAAVGDGVARYAARLPLPALEGADHRVRGAALVALAEAGAPVPREALLPEYVRAPDAKERPR